MTYWVVTMSMHKLTAGSGYDYLTRQVAALDATDKVDCPAFSGRLDCVISCCGLLV
jgi:hypothetical protein